MILPDLFETSTSAAKTITWSKQKGARKLTKNVECTEVPAISLRKKIVIKGAQDGK